MTRRTLLLAGGVAAVSAAAGGGLWYALNRSSTANTAPLSPAEQALWAMTFEQPGGGTLAMGSFLGAPLLLNFWATWCPPCLKEMPLLDAFSRQQQKNGWRVVGLAVDSPTPVRAFLARHPVNFAVGLAGMDGIALSQSLGNPQGSLPFSVAFNRQGRAIAQKMGTLTDAELAAWAR
jgi:thiol-disulfide isomerase/thioredoxin